MELIDETFFLPRLMALQDCVRAEMEKAGGPRLCFSGIVPAGRPPLGLLNCTNGTCGIAWVSPVGVFASDAFPLPTEGSVSSRCRSPLAMRVQVGVARCYPRPKQGSMTLDEQDSFDATRLYLSDMAAVKRALLCCFPQTVERNGDYRVALETWEPMDPEASAAGGTWTAVIG